MLFGEDERQETTGVAHPYFISRTQVSSGMSRGMSLRCSLRKTSISDSKTSQALHHWKKKNYHYLCVARSRTQVSSGRSGRMSLRCAAAMAPPTPTWGYNAGEITRCKRGSSTRCISMDGMLVKSTMHQRGAASGDGIRWIEYLCNLRCSRESSQLRGIGSRTRTSTASSLCASDTAGLQYDQISTITTAVCARIIRFSPYALTGTKNHNESPKSHKRTA
jgi:hypothetical protein